MGRPTVMLLCLVITVAAALGGCGEDRFDATKLYKGMDRSAIIANYGTPDSRKTREHVERLTYKDGEHYQYLLMLIEGRLEYWTQEKVYNSGRYNNIRASQSAGG